MTRRVFVGAAVATLGAAALSGTAVAAPAELAIQRAAGVARLGKAVHVLGYTGRAWVLVDADGSARPTRGLAGADIVDLSSTGDVLIAVGSVAVRDHQEPAVWESADGLAWRRVTRLAGIDGHLTAVGAHGGAALAVGARLTMERAPWQRIVLRRTASGWTALPATGLEYTDELTATAASGDDAGWRLSTVDATGSLIAASPDGVAWTPDAIQPRVVDAAVRSLSSADGRASWVANTMGGSDGVTGALGSTPHRAPVRENARAVGLVDGRSYWLMDGHIVTATV